MYCRAGRVTSGWTARGQSAVCGGGPLSNIAPKDTVARPSRERFGDPIKVHTRFSRWAKSGVWKKLLGEMAGERCGQ